MNVCVCVRVNGNVIVLVLPNHVQSSIKQTQYKELTPNLTRRAQCANWLIFYREELFGYTLEELKEKRQKKKEAEELAKQKEGRGDEWSPPVREVY